MGRAPCCEKMGLKKGPWTAEEDQTLIAYIQRYGHGNWRALPKQAGLLRCGKSCRLRWTNYLRPDIKRGNFSKEEEETIISLHESLGNRWSVIASRLSGRTDNEIKNVWHTHLKKRVKPDPAAREPKRSLGMEPEPATTLKINPINPAAAAAGAACSRFEDQRVVPASPPRSCSDFSLSSATDSSTATRDNNNHNDVSVKEEYCTDEQILEIIDENFWSEALSFDNSTASMDFMESGAGFLPSNGYLGEPFYANASGSRDDDGMDYWLRILIGAGESPELPDHLMD